MKRSRSLLTIAALLMTVMLMTSLMSCKSPSSTDDGYPQGASAYPADSSRYLYHVSEEYLNEKNELLAREVDRDVMVLRQRHYSIAIDSVFTLWWDGNQHETWMPSAIGNLRKPADCDTGKGYVEFPFATLLNDEVFGAPISRPSKLSGNQKDTRLSRHWATSFVGTDTITIGQTAYVTRIVRESADMMIANPPNTPTMNANYHTVTLYWYAPQVGLFLKRTSVTSATMNGELLPTTHAVWQLKNFEFR